MAESESTRALLTSWLEGAEATLQASFELQNASLAAGLALLDAAATSSRTIYQEWDAAARRAQSAALDAFRAQVRAPERDKVAA